VARFLGEANLLAGASSLQDGYVALHGTTGHVLAAEAAGAVIGADACLFVRPEKIGIATSRVTEPGMPANRLDGHIRSVSFLGNVVRYGIDIGAAESLLVDVPNGATSAMHDPGAEVVAYWELRHSRILAHA
jgi:ABC-type Fe3+/spermidine/putrescine transport system ATPase subunit